MRKLWVVRHGERIDKIDPSWVKRAPRGAWDDPTLTERGHIQAAEVGKRLSKEDPIDHVFVSPFIRCLQTATNIVKQLPNGKDLKFNVEPGFVEALCSTQFPPGCLTREELKSHFPQIDLDYNHFLTKFTPEDDDFACEGRIRDTLEHVLNKYPGNTLIVSHGSPIAAIHTVLNHRYKYVGLCTISEYSVFDTGTNSPSNQENEKKKSAKGIHSKYTFKCVLAGDSSHLSDRSNLSEH